MIYTSISTDVATEEVEVVKTKGMEAVEPRTES